MFICYIIVKGDESVSMLSEKIARINIQKRFRPNDDLSPLERTKNYIPLRFLYSYQQRTLKECHELAVLMQTNKLLSSDDQSNVFNYGRITEDILELLAPLEGDGNSQFILINGAPGIGKSMLLKEIAFKWSNNQILLKFELVFLVTLCTPAVWKIKSIKEFIKYCSENKSLQNIDHCIDYYLHNDGKNLMFIFDGYDELPPRLRETGVIHDIVNRKALSQCGLIVASRPHVSFCLQCNAKLLVDILGIGTKHQKTFIQQSLDSQPQKAEELMKYFELHPCIKCLCYIPFNMVALIFLSKQHNPLPPNPFQFYNHVVCFTVSRYLAKHGHQMNDIARDISYLPKPERGIVEQLARMSLETYNNCQFVFTLDDINHFCNDIILVPGAVNGLGLLQAIQAVEPGNMTFYFTNKCMQEFLAAHWLTCLSHKRILSILQCKLHDDPFLHVFSIYISIAEKEQFRRLFKMLMQNSDLRDESKLRNVLYNALFEAGDENHSNVFKGKQIIAYVANTVDPWLSSPRLSGTSITRN